LPVDPTAMTILLVGTYPPTRCGIASFTSDLRASLMSLPSAPHCDVIAIAPSGAAVVPDKGVVLTIRPNHREDYSAAADVIRNRNPDVLCIQHEFGIFGGAAGANLLDLLDAVTCPIASVLHTVLERPSPDEERVFGHLLRRSNVLVVMSEPAREILLGRWGVDPRSIALIPHGAPNRPEPGGFVETERTLDWSGRDLLLSFGLLSPDKGVATVIRALPRLIAARPQALYVVAGVTHPNLVAQEGERHRNELKVLAASIGVEAHLRFVDDYLSTDQLVSCIQAADICLMPYRNPDQVTSGTLSYALGLDRPIISTPFLHARAVLADGQGVIVPFDDPDAIADAAIDMLRNPKASLQMRDGHRTSSASPPWNQLGRAYLDAFQTARGRAIGAGLPAMAPTEESASLEGVNRMTDGCGLLQHSLFDVPNRHHGYCLDDNARALLLMHRLPGPVDAPRLRLTRTFAAFVEHAWCNETSCFRNLMSYERTWLETRGSDDSCGRAFWAAAVTAVDGSTPGLRRWGRHMVARVAPHLEAIKWPRSDAYILLGLCALHDGGVWDQILDQLLEQKSARLADALDARLGSGWDWFEDDLSYDNARLPEALIRIGRVRRDQDLQLTGANALRWLCAHHGTPEGHFRPVGSNGFGLYRQPPAPFDQQPLEAAAMIDACEAAFSADGDLRWVAQAERALQWFDGRNDLGAALADAGNGECYDGLGSGQMNRNQGAESVLARQFALCAIGPLRQRAHLTAKSGQVHRGEPIVT
jgi:glycosyltransferase involved in cell wall biosynthesis